MPYDKLQPLPIPQPPLESEMIGLAGGFVGEMPPKGAALDRSPSMNAVRFQATSVRKDFGYTRMGEVALYRILGLIEHKFIRFQSTFLRLCRLMRDIDNRLRLEVWDSSDWVFVGRTDELIQEAYISCLPIQGVLLMAEGSYIFIWEETFTPINIEQNWPTGNLLTSVGQFTSVILDPDTAINGDYRIRYSVTIRGASTNGIRATVQILHGDEVIASNDYLLEANENPETEVTYHANILVNRPQAQQFDQFHLKLAALEFEDIPPGDLTRVFPFADGSPSAAVDYGTLVYVSEGKVIQLSLAGATNLPAENPTDNIWRVKAALRYNDSAIGRARLRLLLRRNSTGTWEVLDTEQFEVSGTFPDVQTFTEEIEFVWENTGDPIELLDVFRLEASWEPTGPISDPIQSPGILGPLLPLSTNRLPQPTLEWNIDTYGAGGAEVEVHGYTGDYDGDPDAGIEYQIEGEPTSILEVVSPNAPGGRYIFEFANRVVSLRDGGDTQVLAWSASGNVRDWTGPGSGSIALTSSQDDPIDDLMAGTQIGSNIAIILRKRSILRLYATGNIIQALAVVPWINGIGTESPFSLQNVERGAIFLGHNLMVYFINEQGHQAIGGPIHQELIRVLTSNLELVDSTWDPVFNEYILGIPENNSEIITKLWYFDVRRFLDSGELVWRSRELEVQRLATSSSI